MDPRREFEAFLRFLHDNGVQLRAASPFGGWEEGGYEERHLADAYEMQARVAAPSGNGSSAAPSTGVASSAPERTDGAER